LYECWDDAIRAYATAAAEAARADEREACAKACEDMIADQPTETADMYDAGQITAWRAAVDAIRARGE
jgi:hypothetical protein